MDAHQTPEWAELIAATTMLAESAARWDIAVKAYKAVSDSLETAERARTRSALADGWDEGFAAAQRGTFSPPNPYRSVVRNGSPLDISEVSS
jgi:hypothetical protein